MRQPLQLAAKLPPQPYDSAKTYIAVIASDGDNMQAGHPITTVSSVTRLGTDTSWAWLLSTRICSFRDSVFDAPQDIA